MRTRRYLGLTSARGCCCAIVVVVVPSRSYERARLLQAAVTVDIGRQEVKIEFSKPVPSPSDDVQVRGGEDVCLLIGIHTGGEGGGGTSLLAVVFRLFRRPVLSLLPLLLLPSSS